MLNSHHLDIRRGIFLSASGMLILSPDGLLLRLIKDAGTADIVFYRSIFMSITLALILCWLNRSDWRKPRQYFEHCFGRQFDRYAVFACLLMTISNIAFVGAIVNTTVANVLVILAAMPLFSALLGWILIREGVERRTWIAIVFAFSGVVVIFAGSLQSGGWLGNGLALFTALSQGLTLVVLRRAKTNVVLPALCASGLCSAAICFFFASPGDITQHDLTILSVMGLLVVPIALALFLSGTRYIPAAEVALFALLETVIGPILVWLGVGEVPTLATWIGGGFVMTAIIVNSILALRSQ